MINPSLIRSPNLDSWISIDQDSRVHVKSGKVDIGQRISTALTILVGEENFESGIPESFNVLVKEIKALALNVELN